MCCAACSKRRTPLQQRRSKGFERIDGLFGAVVPFEKAKRNFIGGDVGNRPERLPDKRHRSKIEVGA